MLNKNTKQKTKKNKPKVYIPAYKIIILCISVITVCMVLLLITTLLSEPETQESISGRYYKEKINTEPLQDITKMGNGIQDIAAEEKKETKKVPDIKTEEEIKKTKKSNSTIEQGFTNTVTNNISEESKKDFYFPQAENEAELVFVFDDGGHNIKQLMEFISLPFPFTVAILPKLKYSKESADLIRKSGNEVILHQPMQAININTDPGPGAIKPEMTENEILSVLFQNITEIGPVAGMNNHEGSAITADAEKMSIILKFASQEGIFFLDSRTNIDTKVPYVAKELGYSYFERNIFLDNEKTRENILNELGKGLNIANKNGSVIMIGHVWAADILPGILKEIYPELKTKGYKFSTVSKSKAEKNLK